MGRYSAQKIKMMKIAKLIISSMLLTAAFSACFASSPKVIAHRGYWKTAGSAQNSIKALQKADSIRAYGSEFDVWLTADSALVVNHDQVFKGVDMAASPASVSLSVVLDNGERLPSLSSYLEEAKLHPSLRLIFELKSEGDSKRETAACRKAFDMLKKYDLMSRTDFISFSLNACKEFHRIAPEVPVYYLNGELSPKEIKKLGFAGIDYSWKVIEKHPEWVAEAHDLGLKVNVWTVDKPEIMQRMIDLNVDFITTNHPEQLQSLILSAQ